MPNTKSSEKRVRQNTTRRARNRGQRSALRTQVKKMRQLIDEKATAELSAVQHDTQVSLDTAASNGLIHKNKAARLKSRIAKAIARSQAS